MISREFENPTSTENLNRKQKFEKTLNENNIANKQSMMESLNMINVDMTGEELNTIFFKKT